MRINPLKITLKSVQQQGFELLLEEAVRLLQDDSFNDAISHVVLAELLLKVKRHNILEKKQTTYTLSAAQCLAFWHYCRATPMPAHPLARGVRGMVDMENRIDIKMLGV